MHALTNSQEAANGNDAAVNGSPVTSYGSADSQNEDGRVQPTAESETASAYSLPPNGATHAEANGNHHAEETAEAEEQEWSDTEPLADQESGAQPEEASAADAAASISLPGKEVPTDHGMVRR